MSPRGTQRGLDSGAFALLMGRLGPEPDSAGLAYESLRRTLVGFFAWRGAATPDECADETLDRLAQKIAEGVAVEDVRRFASGIARLVLLEHWREPETRHAALDEAVPRAAAPPPDPIEERRHACLDRCLAELPEDGRALIVRYYVAVGRERIDSRKRIASELGVSDSALRNRAQRLRDRLERCLAGCLADTDAVP
jgi:DNA-directed RNA polymerase specialized sigma24 family protein